MWRPFLAWAARLRGEGGQALVEMAVLAPVLILLVLGLINVGDGVNAYVSVVNLGREGARLGAQGGDNAEITTLILNEGERLRGELDPGSIQIQRDPEGEYIEVSLCYEHPQMVPVPLFTVVVDDPVEMCSTTRMPVLPVVEG